MRVSATIPVCLAAAIFAGCAAPQRLRIEPPVEPVMRRVADAVLSDHPLAPSFNWGEGVLMTGMLRAGVVLKEPRYIAFVRGWADSWRDRLGAQLEGPEEHLRQMGYCGVWGPGFAVTLLYEQMRDPAHLAMGQQITAFIMDRATRTPDGGLGHWRGNHQLWCDTLDMACPVLAHVGELTGRLELTEEAARQILVFARKLQDDRTGLLFHMYDAPIGRRVGERWGRGNGWVAMACVEVLKRLDHRSEQYPRLLEVFRRQARGLLGVQDAETGLWYTVLDHPETYVETSASAMILYALLEGARARLVAPPFAESTRKAWGWLASRVDTDGRVIGVSGGTGPTDLDGYASIARGTFPWGTGAFLLAASALSEN